MKAYYITWNKTGETYPVTFASLRRNKIDIVKASLMRVIEIELMSDIPINSTSYSLYLYSIYPPYAELIVRFEFKSQSI